MPIHEYMCPNCQHVEEKLILSHEKPGKLLCPKCGQAKMERIISISSFHLKGKSWSKDNYGLKDKCSEKG